jgi:hypothetical protein
VKSFLLLLLVFFFLFPFSPFFFFVVVVVVVILFVDCILSFILLIRLTSRSAGAHGLRQVGGKRRHPRQKRGLGMRCVPIQELFEAHRLSRVQDCASVTGLWRHWLEQQEAVRIIVWFILFFIFYFFIFFSNSILNSDSVGVGEPAL